MTLKGEVKGGYGRAGTNLRPVLPLIEQRSGIPNLLPNTLNLRLPAPYFVRPDFVVTPAEYGHNEELRFQRCTVRGIACVIMRPDSHEAGKHHGPAHLELMAAVRLRDALGLSDGDELAVEIP